MVFDTLIAAFPPRPLATATMFARRYRDAPVFRLEAEGTTWLELTPRFLEHHHDALAFLTPAAVAEVLPAYLAAVVRNDRALDLVPSILVELLADASDARFAALTGAQRTAVVHALEAWAAGLREGPRRRAIMRALEAW